MSLSIGIVGLPNVGKSTLFNALTRKAVPAENYPFSTIDPSVGVVAVPDRRLDKLAAFSRSRKKIPAAVEFVDIAGLVRGAAEGAGLGNQFLAHIRETDAIAEVVRVFDDSDVLHVEGHVDPVRDIETVNLELVLADEGTAAKRLAALEKDAKRGDKRARAEAAALGKAEKALREGRLLREALSAEDLAGLRHLHFLTAKPILYVLNRKSGGHNLDELSDGRYARLMEFLRGLGASFTLVDAAVEGELADVAEEDRRAFREELGALDGGIDDLIRAGYALLDLITFFTTGEDETRGWTIRRGTRAPEAGAAIHSDFRDKFIRASVIGWDELLAAGSFAAAREKGLVRTEGKDYVVADGDVVEFKI